MQKPPIPIDESERMSALRATSILDTPPEDMFDRITRLVASVLDVPIALVNLIDHDRQWFKSKVGVTINETPRDLAFCAHTILESNVFIVNDTLKDPRFADHPWVTGEPHIRFYAGVPLLSVEDYKLSTLASIDCVPRRLTSAQISILQDLAKITEELLQRREIALATKNLLHSLQEKEERYHHLIEKSSDAFLIQREGIISFANDAAMNLLNVSNADDLIGKSALSIVAPEYLDIVRERMHHALDEGKDNALHEQEWLCSDGCRVHVEVASIPYMIDGKRSVQIIARDISERKKEKLELERLATNDILTGLQNRTLLMDRLHQGIVRWQRYQQKAVVAFLGLDHFKYINDTFGNAAGDQALVAVAKKLSSLLRYGDTSSRIGGDEFVLILEETPGYEKPPSLLEHILEQISKPIMIGSHQISVTCSIGFSRYPDDGTDADALLNAAYAAMFYAKDNGRSNVQRYSSDMRIFNSGRIMLETDLRQALERNELLLQYQPKIDVASGVVVGVEALIRWNHPRLGFVSPGQFIPIAEDSGLIIPIGEWMMMRWRWQKGSL